MNIIDPKKLDYALDFILNRVEQNMKTFSVIFPTPQSCNYYYGVYPNYEWTPGFWTGMLWLAYELTGDNKFRKIAEIQMHSYRERMVHKVCIDTHDIGFIYSLSCVASYKLTGNEYDKETALMAADHLITRFHKKVNSFRRGVQWVWKAIVVLL
ncbi:MAG: glycoside hydrolase family 88 protein [Clostridia bacterium]|nr:glycoside hydrolase family 88 protein [Clostridia bacterium]